MFFRNKLDKVEKEAKGRNERFSEQRLLRYAYRLATEVAYDCSVHHDGNFDMETTWEDGTKVQVKPTNIYPFKDSGYAFALHHHISLDEPHFSGRERLYVVYAPQAEIEKDDGENPKVAVFAVIEMMRNDLQVELQLIDGASGMPPMNQIEGARLGNMVAEVVDFVTDEVEREITTTQSVAIRKYLEEL